MEEGGADTAVPRPATTTRTPSHEPDAATTGPPAGQVLRRGSPGALHRSRARDWRRSRAWARFGGREVGRRRPRREPADAHRTRRSRWRQQSRAAARGGLRRLLPRRVDASGAPGRRGAHGPRRGRRGNVRTRPHGRPLPVVRRHPRQPSRYRTGDRRRTGPQYRAHLSLRQDVPSWHRSRGGGSQRTRVAALARRGEETAVTLTMERVTPDNRLLAYRGIGDLLRVLRLHMDVHRFRHRTEQAGARACDVIAVRGRPRR